MLDRELAIVAQRRPAALGNQVPLLENAEVRLDAVEQVDHRLPPEHPPDDGACLQGGLLRLWEAVDARREHSMHRVRHRQRRLGLAEHPRPVRLDERAAVDELSDELLEEERVAFRPFDHGSPDVLRQSCRDHLVDHACSRVGRKRGEPEDGRVPLRRAPRRSRLEHVRSSGGEDDERSARIRDDALEEIEQIWLGPVDVLDQQHRRAPERNLLDEPHRCEVQLLPRVERVELGSDVQTEREPEDLTSLETALELLGGRTLTECELLAHDLAERPVGDSIAVRETAACPNHRRRLFVREDREELSHETRLPDAGLADEGDEVGLGAGCRAAIGGAEQVELAIAAHEDPAETRNASRPHRPERALDGHSVDASRLALRVDGSCGAELERARSGRGSSLSDEHLARLRGLLEAIGDVHGVARDEGPSFARRADDDVSRVHTDAELELATEEAVHPLLHRQRRMQRALGVILERSRSTEHRHHGVTGELLDRATRELDLLAHRVVEGFELCSHALRVAIAGVGGRADQIGKENRDELALLARAHPGSLPEAAQRALAENRCERFFPDVEPFVQLAVRDRERAEHADAVPVDTGLQQEQPTLERLVDHGRGQLWRRRSRRRIRDELDRDHRAESSHVPDTRPALLPIEHPRAERITDRYRTGDEVFLLEDVQNRRCGGQRDWIADERPSNGAAVRAVHDRDSPEDSGQRQATRDRLRDDDQIGFDVEMLHREHAAGSAEAGLHLVGDEDDAVLVADPA